MVRGFEMIGEMEGTFKGTVRFGHEDAGLVVTGKLIIRPSYLRPHWIRTKDGKEYPVTGIMEVDD